MTTAVPLFILYALMASNLTALFFVRDDLKVASLNGRNMYQQQILCFALAAFREG
jgi:hypothetical protein